jgi:hypothetical protein
MLRHANRMYVMTYASSVCYCGRALLPYMAKPYQFFFVFNLNFFICNMMVYSYPYIVRDQLNQLILKYVFSELPMM